MTAQEFDVVVVGSGGAGMVAALAAAHRGLSTIVIEKAAHYGGSTARSGGGVWIPNNEILQARRRQGHGASGPHVSARNHRRRRRSAADRHLPRAWPRDAVVRAEALAAEDVLGAAIRRLLPRSPGWSGRRTFHRAKAVQRQKARSRPARAGTAVRQGPAQRRCDATGLRAAEPAQASSTRRAAQPQSGRTHDVGEGDRTTPCRHGTRSDRAAPDRSPKGRCTGTTQHRADRPLRRGRGSPRRLCSGHRTVGSR